MSNVKWDEWLREYDARAVFSTLRIPDVRDPIEKNVASIRLSDGKMIDVEWKHLQEIYLVSLYADEYQKQICTVKASTPAQVIAIVRFFASKAAASKVTRLAESASAQLTYHPRGTQICPAECLVTAG